MSSTARAAVSLWPDTDGILPEATVDAIDGSAARSDRDARMPDSSIALLKASGYFGAPVPVELCGRGAGLLDCAAVQRRLAWADGGVAVGLNMHLFSVGIMVDVWRRRRDISWTILEAIATQNRLVASAFAEPGLAGNALRSHCEGRRVGGGYVVTGLKTPCSIASRSDLVSFQFESALDGRRELLIALLPTKTGGLTIERTWNALGMRSSESDSIRLEECFVPDELVFHRCEPGAVADDLLSTGVIWFCATTTATYLGIAQRALHECLRGMSHAPVAGAGTVRQKLPAFQNQLGEIHAQILALEASCVALCSAFDDDRCARTDLLPYALAVKHAAVAVCPEAVGTTAELVGGRAYGADSPLARMWRDVQAVRFHPPTRMATRRMLGRHVSGLPLQFEIDERQPERAEPRSTKG